MNENVVIRIKESIDDKVEVGLADFEETTNDAQEQPTLDSTQVHEELLPNNQKLKAMKKHNRIAEK